MKEKLLKLLSKAASIADVIRWLAEVLRRKREEDQGERPPEG